MSAAQPFFLRVGNVSGTPVVVDIGTNGVSGGAPAIRRVLLSADYNLEHPPGYPARPGQSGSVPFFPTGLVPSGTTLELLKPEADALVTAAYASYA